MCGKKTLVAKETSRWPADEFTNVALKDPSFRNYADYMLSSQFEQAIDRL